MAVYDAVGGQAFFDALVERFYARVEDDPVLRPLYPGDDLTDARRHLALFLGQYWGGPGTYSELRGHPRLRARHLPFTVGQAERDAWMHHMAAAVEAADADDDIKAELLAYFEDAATFMINQGLGPLNLRPPG